MKEEYKDYYKRFLDRYGLNSQINMCIEEMSELTKALCKSMREDNKDNPQLVGDIREELADVLNMVEQLEYYYGVDEVENIRRAKFQRSIDRNLI
jgi:NTP pyrophosphatase (non-canonical NTP hydrolase)